MSYSKIWAMAAALALAAAAAGVAEGQSATETCASKLVPCQDYMNSTNPPAKCCDPLKEAITNDMKCLCNLYNSGLLPGLGIDLNQALLLPKRCKIPGDLNSCVKASAPSSSSNSSGTPPASSGEDKNGAMRIASIGISTTLIFWAFTEILY
ncbi:non-specific lipid transfer protein GPI-anchored 7-like [Diospyros lotus]|uniref:non-specific lipid transfer protein GPI-anchored 7-like n=1 Tax=Diospyros lotus TaxID=55363 RepID=UPI002257CEA5|nr:non-specific lipid transfer protein GPI-anchored 7-like [Diospyros lotus]